MVDLWRRQELQQLQDNLDDDDEGEELFLVGVVHMLASDVAKPPRRHGGSAPWRSKILPKDLQQGHEQIYHDYFPLSPVFREALFRCKYRMIQNLFLCIMALICEYDAFFVQGTNCTGIRILVFHDSGFLQCSSCHVGSCFYSCFSTFPNCTILDFVFGRAQLL
jgi:hypothetical protein